MIEYTTIIRSKDGSQVVELPQSGRITCSWYLNAPGGINFSLPKKGTGLTADDITLGFTEVVVYRDNSLLQAGEIQTRSGALVEHTLSYGAKGWLSLLESRLIGSSVSPYVLNNMDLSAILEDLIIYSQFGSQNDYGLTIGTMATSRLAKRTYEYETIKSAIEGLCNSNVQDALDIEITADKVINSFYPFKGQTLDTVRFELGANIIDYWLTEDASSLANIVTLLGAGDGAAMITSTSTAPNYLLDSYKIRHRTLSFKDIFEQATLDERAEKERLVRQIPKQVLTIHVDAGLAPAWGAYSVGDTVAVNIDDGLVQIDGWYRIYGIELTRTDLGRETAKIVFNPQ